jgi:hypothetical protein
MSKRIELEKVKIKDGFWSPIQNLMINQVIPYQEHILNDKIEGVEKSHAFANFRIAAGLEEGDFYGMVFQDSDVAKWLEAVAYSLIVKPDIELEKRADIIIDTIEMSQQEDGYLNTYFTVKEPKKRWENLHECHELYCAGHMMEAAVAYYQSTGKKKLIEIMSRMTDHIIQIFEKEKKGGISGHQEVEIGLLRMYEVTREDKYIKLAEYFINERGKDPDYFIKETKERGWSHQGMDPKDTLYNQSHKPVRDQSFAEGHSVRALYMYTAMAELATKTNDLELYETCIRLLDNIVNKRMYITGGIGSTVKGEAFTIDYDLPNDTIYAETCASVALCFFASKLSSIKATGWIGDLLERALYNGVLAGMQLDGKKFFYVNPLEINPGISGVLYGYEHVLPERPEWYACACCPPNVARLITSLGQYIWSEKDDVIYAHLFIGNKARFKQATLVLESAYPWEGKIQIRIEEMKKQTSFSLALRRPSYAKNYNLTVNGDNCEVIEDKGYLYIDRVWSEKDVVDYTIDLSIRRIRCNPKVRHNIGKIALMRGPLVYCFEGVDNGDDIQALSILTDGKAEIKSEDGNSQIGPVRMIEIKGMRAKTTDKLYSEVTLEYVPQTLKAIPYYTWGNRGLTQMYVWIQERRNEI